MRSVGGFFGLTEASQRGGVGEIGWQEFAERNIEVSCFIKHVLHNVCDVMCLSRFLDELPYLGPVIRGCVDSAS